MKKLSLQQILRCRLSQAQDWLALAPSPTFLTYLETSFKVLVHLLKEAAASGEMEETTARALVKSIAPDVSDLVIWPRTGKNVTYDWGYIRSLDDQLKEYLEEEREKPYPRKVMALMQQMRRRIAEAVKGLLKVSPKWYALRGMSSWLKDIVGETHR